MLRIGDTLYIPSAYYLYRGEDDMEGGLATVIRIDDKGFVEFEGFLGHFYNPSFLLEEQKELKKRFGKQKAHKAPDYRPEFNQPEADWH